MSEAPAPEGSRRVEAARPGRASVSVELRQQGEQAVGVAEGALATGSPERLVAEATLRAAGGLDSDVGRVALDTVTVAAAGAATVATTVLVHGERSLVGVAVVNAAGAADAVARAVVDALARRSASP